MNFNGLVKLHTLPKNRPLLPLFEAVINSIQSIEESGRNDGWIEITIQREKQLQMGDDWESDVENIIIQDNGIGFTNDNFASFDTYASDYKLLKGCKGVGRMLWLKAFSSVEVESIYQEDGTWKKRSFLFDAIHSVHDMVITNWDGEKESGTTVKLKKLLKEYKKCPQGIDTIAKNIMNHCFAYYVLKKVPKIIVCDEKGSIDIDQMYQDSIDENIVIQEIEINHLPFQLIHSKNYMMSNDKHTLHLCANQRVVQSDSLSKFLTGLNTKLEDEKGQFIYQGYLLSEILDNNVNRERTKFNLPEESSLVESIGFHDIYDHVKTEIEIFLKKDIEERNEKKKNIIMDYICHVNPKYRILLKNCPNLIHDLPFTEDHDKLEMELFKQEQKFKLALKKEGKELEKQSEQGFEDYESYMEKRTNYAEKLSDMGKSNLAEYVMHRKAVLDVLSQNLKYRDEEHKRYAYEKNIHKLIFPMVKTSDDIDYLHHNLWIIDEKLAYHHYLASDMKLKSMNILQNESGKEPDILIFDAPFAFTDEDEQPYRNVTIIEFKRPGREHYQEDDNPIRQVKEYMNDISEGKIKNKDGEYLENTEDIRYYCYIICDMDASMKKIAKMEDMKKTPDQMGYYRYIESYNAYMEIIPYQKMIQDSKKRNKILFDKLFNLS